MKTTIIDCADMGTPVLGSLSSNYGGNTFIGYNAEYNIGIGISALMNATTGNSSTPVSWYQEIKWDVSAWLGDLEEEINNWINF